LHYGNDSLQFGDLRIPAGEGLHPVAIIVHGGCYLSYAASLDYIGPMADSLCKEGIATWNIEYNRVDHPNGGWPGTFTDIAKAIDYLRNISEANNLNLDNVIIVGHSAGAHLALWAAARSKISPESDIYEANPLPLRGVVALAPPVDLERSIGPAYEVCKDSVITKLLGGLPDRVPKNYKSASPIELLPIGIPQRLFVGEYDIPVIMEHTAVYYDSALILNEDIELDTIKEVGHNGISDPGSLAWPKVRAAIRELLNESD